MFRVLVIDDSLTIRKIVEMTLRNQPMSVTLCEDTQQGREALRRAVPDLILLDYILPEQNGAEFLASLPEEFSDIPVIVMTAKDLSIRQQFRDFHQVTGYLTKPFSQNQLLQKIKKKNTGPIKPPANKNGDNQERNRQHQLAQCLFEALQGPLHEAVKNWQRGTIPLLQRTRRKPS